MLTLLWVAVGLLAVMLRHGIRWHVRRWLMASIPRRASTATPRRLLLDPLVPIIPTRRLLS